MPLRLHRRRGVPQRPGLRLPGGLRRAGRVVVDALDRAVRLDVTPAYLPVIEAAAGTVWTRGGSRAHLLALTTIAAEKVKDVDLVVTASAGLLIACGSDTAPAAAAYAPSCRLTAAWTFAASGDAQLARQYVWVKPATAAVLVGNVTFDQRCRRELARRGVVHVADPQRHRDPARRAATRGRVPRVAHPDARSGWYTLDAGGVLSVRPDATAAALRASVPLRAWEIDGAAGEKIVDFYDATRMLADSGKLRASSTKFTYVDWRTARSTRWRRRAPPRTSIARSRC